MDDYKNTSENKEEDGTKELNDRREEHYQYPDGEAEDHRNGASGKKIRKTLYDRIRGGLILVSYIIFIFSTTVDFLFPLTSLAITLYVLAFFLLPPVKKWIAGGMCSKILQGLLSFQVILFLIVTVSLYFIFVSDRYDLHLTYWFALLGIFLLATISILEDMVWDYRERKEKGRAALIGRSLLNLVLFLIWSAVIAVGISFLTARPQDIVRLDDPRVPARASIYRTDDDRSGNQSLDYNQIYSITDTGFLTSLTGDMEGSTLEAMDTIAVWNFKKMERIRKPYHILMLEYNFAPGNHFLEYPMTQIIVMENQAIIKAYSIGKNTSFWNKNRVRYYQVQLSEKTMELLYSHIDILWN